MQKNAVEADFVIQYHFRCKIIAFIFKKIFPC